jgi:hypothetical protein
MSVPIKRDVPDEILEAIKNAYYPVLLVHVDWPDAPIFAHTGEGNILLDGQTWLGVSEFGAVTAPEEDQSDVAVEAELIIAGTEEKVLEQLDDNPLYRDADIYWGLTTEPGGNVLIGVMEHFIGYVSDHGFSKTDGDPGEHVGRLTLGSGPSARSGATVLHSHEDQIANYPSDTLFEKLVYASTLIQNPEQW